MDFIYPKEADRAEMQYKAYITVCGKIIFLSS
jgi:hypothetical protein